MAAQIQCGRPHGCFESQRNSPATVSQPYREPMPGLVASNIDTPSELRALRSPFAPQPSLPIVLSPFPPSPCTRPPTPSQDAEDLDQIDMLSTIVSFGTHSGVTPDVPSTLVVHTYEDLVRITSLERQVCSNYVCCGIHLVDFHALINHFEERHVSVVAPNGKRIYPPERLKQAQSMLTDRASDGRGNVSLPCSVATTPASSRSSSVVSSAPPTPVTPVNLCFDAIAPTIHTSVEYNPYMDFALSFGPPNNTQRFPYNSDIISAFGPEYDFSKDYACYEQNFTEKIEQLRQQEQREKEERERDVKRNEAGSPITDSGISIKTTETLVDSVLLTCPSDAFDGDAPPALSRKPVASSSIKKTSRAQRDSETPGEDGSISNDGGKVAKSKAKTTGTSTIAGNPVSSSGRKREKTYKCPRHGCSKSYLNPNGLKYHLEKGTCKFDDSENGGLSDGSKDSPAESPTASSNSANPPLPNLASSILPLTASSNDSVASTSFTYQYSTTPITVSKLDPTQFNTPSTASLGPSSAFNSLTPEELFQSILMQPTTASESTVTARSQQQPLPEQIHDQGSTTSSVPCDVRSAIVAANAQPIPILTSPRHQYPDTPIPWSGAAYDGALPSSL